MHVETMFFAYLLTCYIMKIVNVKETIDYDQTIIMINQAKPLSLNRRTCVCM